MNIIKNLFHHKKADKENRGNEFLNGNRHVNFESNNGRRSNHYHFDDENSDFFNSNERRIRIPNPYDVVTKPSTRKGPCSYAGRELCEDYEIDKNNSFQSDLYHGGQSRDTRSTLAGNSSNQNNASIRKERRFFKDDISTLPLRDSSNRKSLSRKNPSTRNSHYRANEAELEAAAAAAEQEEEDHKWAIKRMMEFEFKNIKLSESLQMAINKERKQRMSLELELQRYNKLLKKYLKEKNESSRLRFENNELKEEMKKLQLIIAQMNVRHLPMDPRHMNLITTPTNINQLMPSHQLHTILNNSNSGGAAPHSTKQMSAGVENFNGLSPSSLSLISQANTNSAVLASGGSRQQQQQHPPAFYNPHRQLSSLHPLPMPPILPADGYPFNFPPFNNNDRLNEIGEESSHTDEIKNFRNQEQESFSASSRPGTLEMDEVKRLKNSFNNDEHGFSSRATTNHHSDTSSPEIVRGGINTSANVSGSGPHFSASCLELSRLYDDDEEFENPNEPKDFIVTTKPCTNYGEIQGFFGQHRDEGYATSETASTSAPPPKNKDSVEKEESKKPKDSSISAIPLRTIIAPYESYARKHKIRRNSSLN